MSKLENLSKKFVAPDHACAVVDGTLNVLAAKDLDTEGALRRMQVQVKLVGSRYEVGLGYFYPPTDRFAADRIEPCKNMQDVRHAVTRYLEPAVRQARVEQTLSRLPESPFANLTPLAKEHLLPQVYA